MSTPSNRCEGVPLSPSGRSFLVGKTKVPNTRIDDTLTSVRHPTTKGKHPVVVEEGVSTVGPLHPHQPSSCICCRLKVETLFVGSRNSPNPFVFIRHVIRVLHPVSNTVRVYGGRRLSNDLTFSLTVLLFLLELK